MLTQMIYSSRAVKPFSSQALKELLALAQERNRRDAVTGVLLYDNGAFLQVLEGARATVESVFSSIQRDPRHNSIRVLEFEGIDRRAFQHWSMAFVDIADVREAPPDEPSGWQELATGSDAGSRAKRYLQFFQADLYRQLAKGSMPGVG